MRCLSSMYNTYRISYTSLWHSDGAFPRLAGRDQRRRSLIELFNLEIIPIGVKTKARVFQHAVLALLKTKHVAAGETAGHSVSRDAASATEVAAEGLYGWCAGGRWND